MTDHYQTLGVNRTASPDEIKRAYRKLASQHHPDKGGDKGKFQEVEEAYRTLGDPTKRQQYDNPRPQGFGGFEFHNAGPGGFDFQTIFDVFGTRFQQPQQRAQRAQMTLWITLQDVAQAARKTISVGTPQGTQVVEIDIPANVDDGNSVQYSGIGPGGMDLIITFRIHPNPKWARAGLHLTTEHAISIWDCMVGGTTEIRDILGNQINLTIPALTQPGSLLRLKGRGLSSRQGSTGDLLVRIQAKMPSNISTELSELIKQEQKK